MRQQLCPRCQYPLDEEGHCDNCGHEIWEDPPEEEEQEDETGTN